MFFPGLSAYMVFAAVSILGGLSLFAAFVVMLVTCRANPLFWLFTTHASFQGIGDWSELESALEDSWQDSAYGPMDFDLANWTGADAAEAIGTSAMHAGYTFEPGEYTRSILQDVFRTAPRGAEWKRH